MYSGLYVVAIVLIFYLCSCYSGIIISRLKTCFAGTLLYYGCIEKVFCWFLLKVIYMHVNH